MHFLPANGSHFDATDYIFAGQPAGLGTGWLGRLARPLRLDAPTRCRRSRSARRSPSRSARAERPSARCRRRSRLSLRRRRRRLERERERRGRAASRRFRPRRPALTRSRSIFWTTVNVSNQLGGTTPPGANPDYPASSLSDRLKTAATLLSANLGVKVVTIDWGSFDTHGSQSGGHGSADHDPVARARRVQERPRRPRYRAARHHRGLHRVRAARRGERLPGDAITVPAGRASSWAPPSEAASPDSTRA